MNIVHRNQRVCLILNANYLPLMVTSASVAIKHILCGRIKGFDKYFNSLDSDSWFKNKDDLSSIYFEDQPLLTSQTELDPPVYQYWPVPTIGITNTSFFLRKRGRGVVTLKRLVSYYGPVCQICGKTCHPRELTIEHVFPKSKGGTLEEWNVLPTCKPCNSHKSDKHPYYDKSGVLLEDKIKSWPIFLNIVEKEIREEWKTFLFKK